MKCVLVIEDEASIREIIADMLEDASYQVVTVEDGATGVEWAQHLLPDLIICDIMMPQLDGYGVLTQLRQDLRTATIPFIFLSAKSDRPDIRRGMVLGADDYITKPFTRTDLLDAIDARLEKQAAAQKAFSVQAQAQNLTCDIQESELYRALDQKEFELFYQPQVSLATGQITGVEALIRWRSPQLGLVPPAQFIPLAEKTGFICVLGDWILHTACHQMHEWHQQRLPLVSIAVNLSSLQFDQYNLTEKIAHTLTQTGLNPQLLEIELTESLLVRNVETTIQRLKELKQLGIQVAIDDFGTGYASLGYLQHFPFDVLKIDRCFVSQIERNPTNAAIVSALVQMAKQLRLRVTAEGVETQAELDVLAQFQCDAIQGYHISKPLPAHELIVFHSQFCR